MMDVGKPRTELIEELRELRERLAQMVSGQAGEQGHFIQALIDAIPNPIFYKNTRGVYLGCNTAFAEKVIGLPRSRIVGATVYELTEAIPLELAEAYHQSDLDLLTSRGSQVYEAPMRFADGSTRQVLFNKAVLEDSSGRVAGMVGILLDVTGRRADEAAWADVAQAAERRSARRQVAAEIAEAAAALLSMEELLSQSVALVQERLGFRCVAVYLLDAAEHLALLRASCAHESEGVGHLERQIVVDRDSVIGAVILNRQLCAISRADNPTFTAPEAFVGASSGKSLDDPPTEDTPEDTVSVVVPLVSRGETLGAVWIEAQEGDLISEDDCTILTTFAGQLAVAIDNARLHERAQANLVALQRLQRRDAVDMWQTYVEEQEVLGYSYDLDEVTKLMVPEQYDVKDLPADPVLDRGREGGDGARLLQPLEIRGEPVGLLSFEAPGAIRDWSDDQLAVLQAVSDQLALALENRLLIDRSQRALREAQQREAELGFLHEISALLNATTDVVAARATLLERLQAFTPINQFTLMSWEAEAARLRFLTAVGVAIIQLESTDQRAGLTASDGCETYVAAAALTAESAFESVAANGTWILREDLRSGAEYPEEEALAAVGVVSRLLLPLRLGRRLLGVLELGSGQVDAFSRPGLLSLLEQVAAQLASALERGNLLRTAQGSAEESRRLYEVTADLAEAVGGSEVLQAVIRHAFPEVPVRAEIGLYTPDPETQAQMTWLEIVASTGESDAVAALAPGTRISAAEIPELALLEDGGLYACADVEADAEVGGAAGITSELRAAYRAEGVRGVLVLALAVGAGAVEQLGVLRVRSGMPLRVTEQDLRLYRTIADQAAVVLSNRRLFEQSQARIARQAVAVELASLTTALSEQDALLQAVVDFLAERFDLYFAGIFLVDGHSEWAVLRAGSGELGERLMLMGHRVQVDGGTMNGRAIQTRQRLVAPDIEPRTALGENPLLAGMRSAVVFPLISRGQTQGAVTLQSGRRFAFTEEDVATLALMINQLANVIESTNLYERSQSSLAETRMLYRIAQQITDARDAEAVLQAAVDGIAQRDEPDWIIAGLLTPHQEPTALSVVAVWCREPRGDVALTLASLDLVDIPRFYEVLRLDERFVTPDITQDPMVDDFLRRLFGDLELRATAAFQLRVRGKQYGMLMVHSRHAREFSTAELSFYENVARQAFVALENLNLVEVTRELAERRAILNEVLQTASSALVPITILGEVGEVIARRLQRPVIMWSWEAETSVGGIVRAASMHASDGDALLPDGETYRLGRHEAAPLYAAIDSRSPVTLHLEKQAWTGGWPERLGSPLVDGYAVPLVARARIYGVMMVARTAEQAAVNERIRELLETVGANLSVALETASLYREAQETAAKLQEVDELKNQFMANMSHELRTPLNSIIGFSRVMLKGIDGPLTEMQETDLTAIYDSGRHLLNLINDILDISKINAGKMEIVFEPVDLKDMITSVMSTALGFVKDKPVELRTYVAPDLPMIVADGRRIRQVLINLLGNAGKFTEQGFIEVSATFDSEQVVVSVEDSGIGIAPGRLHAVFEQFEQVDATSTRRYGGTGLGIPLSREFVRLHGGDMWIEETTVGKGTTFCFSLPIGGPQAVPAETGGGRVVLTVDDDESIVMLFRRFLAPEGYQVFGLTNSAQVVAEAKRLRPYAITLDVLMPGEDGWATIRVLKSDPATRDIPIIVCSILGDRERGMSLGVADYLVKPISEDALRAALVRVGRQREDGDVLVVDDNREDRKLLRRILESAGHDVREASGGAEALEILRWDPPALLVLDLMMPQVDGFAVLEALKQDSGTRTIPVIVVTAKDLTKNDEARLQERAEALIQKGLFDQQQLLTDVKMALERLDKRRLDNAREAA